MILVRHGQQEWPDPIKSVTADWVDPPLSELGRRQAAAVASHLATEPVDAVYSSHLLRAHHTGMAIAEHHGLDVTVRPEMEEIHLFRDLPQDQRATDALGEAAMDDIRAQFVITRRWDSYPHTERSLDFRSRVVRALDVILDAHHGQNVVVACHGGVINAYFAHLLGTDQDFFYRPVHASIHRVLFKQQTRAISVLNEQHYLTADGLLSN